MRGVSRYVNLLAAASSSWSKTDLDSELMLFNEEANEVMMGEMNIVYVLAWIIVINIY